MGRTGWVIGEAAEHRLVWRIDSNGRKTEPDLIPIQGSFDQQAKALAAFLARHGYRGEGVLVWIASSRCLVGTTGLADHRAASDRIGIGFDFETVMPLSAEEFVADYVVHERKVLGVALEVNYVVPWIEALEQHGVVVQSIVPKSLLAVQALATSARLGSANLVLWRQGDWIEVFGLAEKTLRFWEIVQRDADAIVQRLALISLTQSERACVATIDLPDGWSPLVSTVLNAESVSVLTESLDDGAFVAASSVLQGNYSPWIDFRREALPPHDPYRPVRGPLHFALVSAALCLVAAAAGLLIKAWQFEEQSLQYQGKQAKLFELALPGQSAPIGVKSRLESELAKLAGVTGQQADLPKSESALAAFQETLSAMPSNLRFRLLELRIEQNGNIHIDAEVRSHGDTSAIAAALKNGGLEVSSPQSRQLTEGGVSVQIQATPRRSPLEVKENPT